jgi:hypothetical protein
VYDSASSDNSRSKLKPILLYIGSDWLRKCCDFELKIHVILCGFCCFKNVDNISTIFERSKYLKNNGVSWSCECCFRWVLLASASHEGRLTCSSWFLSVTNCQLGDKHSPSALTPSGTVLFKYMRCCLSCPFNMDMKRLIAPPCNIGDKVCTRGVHGPGPPGWEFSGCALFQWPLWSFHYSRWPWGGGPKGNFAMTNHTLSFTFSVGEGSTMNTPTL